MVMNFLRKNCVSREIFGFVFIIYQLEGQQIPKVATFVDCNKNIINFKFLKYEKDPEKVGKRRN